MKTIKRILFVLLAVILTVSAVASVGAETLTFTDTNGHWAWTGGYIPYLVEKNVLNGYPKSDGTYYFKPDGEVTRAEFIKMLDETFGLTATKAVSFSDVKSSDWFCVYFQKAAAQGYILNYGSSCDPNGKITREEAISLLVRYLDLNPEEKASASTFTDYNTISEKYQDYVLEAIYAGLIDGYKQTDGTYKFKPANTLTRAEALTILYRAAGCIFNKTSYVRDGGAAETNNVITKGNITIQDQTLTGRTIISEGAKDGIVTFSNCKIDGTLYVRGNSKVYFDKCVVDEIVVTGNGGISLLTNSTVKTINLQKKATVSVTKGTKVGTINVGAGAAGASVIGEGVVDEITVRATGVTSQIMPSEYKIFNGLTASFAGKTYTGTNDDNGIFKIAPFATSDKTYNYIEFTATKDGSAYYYYTNSTALPSDTEFDEQYQKAQFKGYIPGVKADTAVSHKTYTAAQLKGFGYVVVMFQSGSTKYTPVLVNNNAADNDGFSTAPYYSDSDNTIKFKTSANGTVYMFYTDKADAMTQSKFLTEYENAQSANKKTVPATAASVTSIALTAANVEKYGYVAVMLKSASGAYYTPVVVAIADDGFAEVPTVKTSGKISYKADVVGTLYYYYSKTEDVPTADNFEKVFKAATYKGYTAVSKNVAATLDFKPSYASMYPYMIVCIKTAEGYKLPVCVKLGYASGFIALPKLVSETLISFTTESPSTVQFYYTNNETAPSAEFFSAIYSSMDTLKRGTVNCYTSEYQGLINIPETVTEKYIVIMLTDTNNNTYAPIVLSTKYDPNDLITGFVYDPYIKNGEVYINTVKASLVRYYYSTSTASVTAEEFNNNFYKADASYKGTLTVTPNTLYKHPIDNNAKLIYRTIVIATWNGSTYSEPVVLNAFENTPVPGNTSGFTYSVVSGVVIVTPNYTGKLYYYTTDVNADAVSATFDKSKATVKDVEATKAVPVENSPAKKYIILALEANDRMFDKVVLDATTGKPYVDEKYNDGATSTETMIVISSNDTDRHVIDYTTKVNGYVFFTLVGDNEIIEINGSKAKANAGSVSTAINVQNTFDYSAAYAIAQADTTHSHVYLYIQATDNSIAAARYKSVVLVLK